MPAGFTTVSGQFFVNSSTDFQQLNAQSVYLAGAGGSPGVFGVVFETEQTVDGDTDLHYREINPDGSFATSEVAIVSNANMQRGADIAVLNAGEVVVAWAEADTGTVNALIGTSGGVGQNADFSDSTSFNAFGTASPANNEVTLLALDQGGFVLGANLGAGEGQGFVRSFDPNGTARGAADQITSGTGTSRVEGLAQLSNGTVIAQAFGQSPTVEFFGLQSYTTGGAESGGFNTLTYDTVFNFSPEVVTLANGRLLEVYSVQNVPAGGPVTFTINGRILSAQGDVLTDLGVLNDLASQDHLMPQVVATDDGGFVLGWQTGPRGNVFDNSDIVMRRFDADGDAVGASVQVNDSGTGFHDDVALTLGDAGELLVTWTNTREDFFDRSDVLARTYTLDDLSSTGITLSGTPGNDRLNGTAGNDTLTGFDGNDILDGRGGSDVMNGGLGNDFYFVDTQGDQIIGEIAFSQGGGIDTVRSFVDYVQPDNIELVRLGFLGGTANLNAVGNDGPGTLVGNAGDNILTGRGGNDQLNGNGGDDTIIGNTGRDTLVGGGGADTFIYTSISESRTGSANRDLINGFDRGFDQIDLSEMDANLGGPGDAAFDFVGRSGFSGTAGELRLQALGGPNAVLIEADLRGDGVADFQIFVNGRINLDADDFIL